MFAGSIVRRNVASIGRPVSSITVRSVRTNERRAHLPSNNGHIYRSHRPAHRSNIASQRPTAQHMLTLTLHSHTRCTCHAY